MALPVVMALAMLADGGAEAAAARRVQVAVDTLTAREAFVEIPANVLDIIPRRARLDMIDYYSPDSVRHVPNAMEGLSGIIPPLSKDFMAVEITPVSEFQLRVLDGGKKRQTLVTSYTVGDSLQAKDSDVRFYDASMHQLRREKLIKLARIEDFIDPRLDKNERKALMTLVPFPSMVYTLSPESDCLKVSLTVDRYMGREDFEKLKPHLIKERIYRWNGKKYVMEKIADKK